MKSTTVKVYPKGQPSADHTLSKLDLNYIQTGNSVGIGYVFDKALPVGLVKDALAQVLAELPPLAGRLTLKNLSVSGDDLFVPFEHVIDYPGSAQYFVEPALNITNRTDFINEPSRLDVLSRRAQLMCVKLTDFAEGGSILGVTINHGLMDAAGFHLVMRRWSELVTDRQGEALTFNSEIFTFKTDRSRAQRQADIEAASMAKPVNCNTVFGRVLCKAMYRVLDKIRLRGRELVYYSVEDITAIKDRVLAESGLEWVSTNVALSAHILHAIIPLQLPHKCDVLAVGNVINIRNRVQSRNAHDQALYLGNALYIMVSECSPQKSVHDLSRGEIAAFLQNAFSELSPWGLTEAMRNIVDSLEDGYGYPGLNIFKPILALNNQSKFDVYDVDFGVGRPIRVIPQDVGDHVMMFPAADGGTEVYLRDFASLKRQKKLLEPKWQARLLDV